MSAAIDRRRFLGTTVMTAAAAEFFTIGSADAHSRERDAVDATAPVHPLAAFRALKQIEAGVLNVGYAEAGPAHGPPVILLHGWPYDIHSFVDVAPLLASAGYRVIVPHLAGMARRVSSRRTPSGMRSRRWSRSTSSR
jgi:hypothetical protein